MSIFEQDDWAGVTVSGHCTRCSVAVSAQVPSFLQQTWKPWCDPCATQAHAEQLASDAVQEASRLAMAFEGTIPKAYRWAAEGAPALRDRVTSPGSHPEALLARIGAAKACVVFVGPAGSGKTSLAVAALRKAFLALPTRGKPKYFHATKLGVVRIQTPAGQGESPMVLAAMQARIALIDDLGAERQTSNNAIPDIIQWRHAEELPTWVTTGLTRSQIAERYSDGVARRLLDGAEIIRLGKVQAA